MMPMNVFPLDLLSRCAAARTAPCAPPGATAPYACRKTSRFKQPWHKHHKTEDATETNVAQRHEEHCALRLPDRSLGSPAWFW